MPRAIAATCENGVVTAEGVVVPGTVILSQGVGPSSGILVIDEDKKYFVAKTSPDVDATLESVIDALEAIVATIGALKSAVTNPVGGVTSLAATAVTAVSTAAIDTAKNALETLQGELR
jgi:hypothetical protein